MKNRFRILCFTLALSSAVLHAAPVPVAASFSILGDLVQAVGGERISISTLVGPDQDAHIFQPAPADVQKLSATRLFFVNGLGFEGWQNRLLQSSRYTGKTITVTQHIQPLKMHDDGHGHGSHDPHAWQDPEQVKTMVQTISKALIATDPSGSAYFQKRADGYTQELDQLTLWAKAEVARIPPNKRVVLTSHDAFGYLARSLGIRIISPQGVSTESEASAKEVGKIIRQIKQSGIRALFMENISNPKMVEQIARETGVRTDRKLYSDALSRNPEAATYLKMYRYNVTTLIAGMQGNQ